ncbi:TPA: hypothetical protein OUB76_001639 [Enterococcus faecalis]|nr:hypothetical protein [Enterococcus faecalis]
MKKIWQLACLENNYNSHSSYFRDMVRYFFYTLLAILLFFLGLYFNIDWLGGFCLVGLILLPYMVFLSHDNYREFAPKVWKIRDVRELEELYPVVVDRVKDRLLFYEKKLYLMGDSLKHADSMKEGFVLSEISLENELIFNASIAKKSCIVVEEYVYENVNFEEEFQNKKNQEAPVLRYIVYTNNFLSE